MTWGHVSRCTGATAPIVLIAVIVQQAAAQVAPPPPAVARPPAAEQPQATDVIRIRRMPRLNSRTDWVQRTPVYAGTASRRPRDWGVFEVVFDSSPEWIDELVVTFHVMLQSADPREERPFSLCRVTSRYIDVAQGRGRQVSAVLLPSALLRHGRPIGFAVEFAIGGQVVAAESSATEAFLRDRWWENPQVVDSPRTTQREGYLLERADTPFALLNIDDNEVSR